MLRKIARGVLALVLAGVFSVSSAAAALELNIIAAPDVASWIERNASRFSERVGQEVNISVKQIWGEPYVEELTLIHAANVPYDVIQVNPGRNYHRFARLGLFLPLDGYIARDGFDVSVIYPPIYQHQLVDGNTYALAFAAHPGAAGVYYNTVHFERRGLAPPDYNWTFDDFADYAVRLTEIGPSGDEPVVYGLELPSFYYISPAFDADLVNPERTEVIPNRNGLIEALEWLLNLKERRGLIDPANGPVYDGRSSMKIQGPWEAINLRQSIIADSWDVAPFPTGPAGKVNGGAAWDGFAIPRTSQNPDLAWEFVRFMLEEEALVDYAAMGGNPVANVWINLIPELLGMTGREVYIRALESGQFVFDWPQEVQSLAERYIGGWNFGPFLLGEMSAAETVEVLAVETANALQRLAQQE